MFQVLRPFLSSYNDYSHIHTYIVFILFTFYTGPRFKTSGDQDCQNSSRPALRPPHLLYNGYQLSLPGVKQAGVAVTNHPLLVLRLSMHRTILYFPSVPAWHVMESLYFLNWCQTWTPCNSMSVTYTFRHRFYSYFGS